MAYYLKMTYDSFNGFVFQDAPGGSASLAVPGGESSGALGSIKRTMDLFGKWKIQRGYAASE